MLQRKDWLLATVGAAGASGLTPVQLQKALFLVEKGAAHGALPTPFYHFRPYDYGPFDAAVYHDADLLAFAGAVRIEPPSSMGPRRYVAASEDAVRAARASIGATGATFVDGIVSWVCSKGFSELVRAVYDLYPEMKANSVFRG